MWSATSPYDRVRSSSQAMMIRNLWDKRTDVSSMSRRWQGRDVRVQVGATEPARYQALAGEQATNRCQDRFPMGLTSKLELQALSNIDRRPTCTIGALTRRTDDCALMYVLL